MNSLAGMFTMNTILSLSYPAKTEWGYQQVFDKPRSKFWPNDGMYYKELTPDSETLLTHLYSFLMPVTGLVPTVFLCRCWIEQSHSLSKEAAL